MSLKSFFQVRLPRITSSLFYMVTLAPTRQRVLNDLQFYPEQQWAFEADFMK